ncbi:MAG: NifB/NifX family molybdenum-iron cluster-binding protein [Halobacteriota archaeon]
MKVAIATENEAVCQHFGHCPEYTIYTIEGNSIRGKETIQNPGHRPNFLPGYLHERGVDVIIAGGMGVKAQKLFEEAGVEPVLGVEGSVEQVAERYVQGELERGSSMCEHGLFHHNGCSHE